MDDLNSNVKRFANDTSLFTIVHDVNSSATELDDQMIRNDDQKKNKN